MRIGVIADTHGLVRPEVHNIFAGVQLILHAGDIGGDAVLCELSNIARVIGVRGNTDSDLGPPQFPDTRRLTLEGIHLFLCHQVALAHNLSPVPDVVIYGHTHQAANEYRNGILWYNPGTAGKPQFSHRALTVGILTLEHGAVRGEIIPL